jgi:hypothetical protein
MGKIHCINPFVIGIFSLSLISSLFALDVSIAWDRNKETDVVGYKVYWGYASRKYPWFIDVSDTTAMTIENLPDSVNIYFAVTAYDENGNESDYSQELRLGPGPGFVLGTNYPNPFNPSTQIPFFLMKRIEVHLAIYDILGREVKLLVEGEKDAGNHLVLWDGANQRGQLVANGIYFVRLVVGQYARTRKMVLVR